MEPLPTLILTVGLPRSGKSTWAKRSGYPVVCPDAIRLALHGQRYVQSAEPFVWATARLMVASLFGAGHQTVVLDACNVTSARRMEWLNADWELRFMPITTPAQGCIDRAKRLNDNYIIPIIERMAVDLDWEGVTTRTVSDGPPGLIDYIAHLESQQRNEKNHSAASEMPLG